MKINLNRSWLCLALAAALASCATQPPAIADGRRLIAEGRIEEGLRLLETAANTPPQNAQAHALYVTQRDLIVGVYVRDGDTARITGDHDTAEARFRTALRLDRTSAAAQAGLDATQRERRQAQRAASAQEALAKGDFVTAEREARAVLAENSGQRAARGVMKLVAERNERAQSSEPLLKAALARSISLEFKDAPLRTVFEMMSRTGGLNFIIDRDVKVDQRTTLFVRDTSLEDVLKVLLLTNQLEKKVLNDNSLIIYPNTPTKQREYLEMVTRSFFLANADVKQTAAMVRAMVKTRDIFVDEKLNLLMLRDTPEAIRLAEQLIATQDLGEPEVMLELEVLEVASTVAQEIGTRFPDQIVGSITNGVTEPNGLTRIGSGNLRALVANPVLLINLHKLDGTSNILANPRIRVKNREKAHVHIGEKVPVITTTSTANVGVSSSVSYLETGLKLDVEPNIFLEDEVAIKVQLEVSNIVSQLNASGTIAYRLGTRNAATSLRLRDGETQVLAGLINNEDRQSVNKLPYLADFPVLGRLFQNDNRDGGKTEIVLLITPRIVRNISRPDTVAAQILSGTDAAPGAPPVRLAMAGSMAMSLEAVASGAGQPGKGGAAQRPGAADSLPLTATAPQQAGLGEEFSVTLTLPAGASQQVDTTVNLSFDPAMLAPVGAAANAGRVAVTLSTSGLAGVAAKPASTRFKVIARQAGSTQIGYEVTAANLPVLAPPATPLVLVTR
nr:secretin and TonB N-terminal domain-containing protein [uncultured Roseateles sp.]